MKLPTIFIFDIDECIIGKVDYCIYEYNILDIIHKKCKTKKITNKCIKAPDISKELNEGLLRPNFSKFIDFIRKKYKNVELYVYTNSTYAWVHNGLISSIEKASGVKFNKPYFTRENSNDYEKLLGNIYDIIIKGLLNKYPALSYDNNKELVFKDKLVFIDDRENNLGDFPKKQILCPKYKYVPKYYNIKEKIIKQYGVDEIMFEDKDVLEYYDTNWFPLYNINGSVFQKDMMLQNMYEMFRIRQSEINNKDINDTFFEDLMKLLQNVNKLDEKSIETINKNIKKDVPK